MEYRFSVMRKNHVYPVESTNGIAEVPAAQAKLKELIQSYPSEEYEIFMEVSINVIEHTQVDVSAPEKQMIDLGNKLLSRVSDG